MASHLAEPRKWKHAESGYTLVEIGVALLVIGIGFTALLSVFPVGLKWSEEAAANSTAALAAQTAISKYSYDDPTGQYDTISGWFIWQEGIADTTLVQGGSRPWLVHVYVECYPNERSRDDPNKEPMAKFKGLKYVPAP